METELPQGVELVRTTAEFDEHSVPAGLLRDHRIASGVWGRLVVRSGSLRFGFGDDEEFEVGVAEVVVIPPDHLHHVSVVGPVSFVVEFHAPMDTVTT